ncbi:MAG: hypothetical protein II296_00475 [Bacteroidaceae bacterium]|nr:hypothetical protein [Bacteroidaceae bacterium]
MRSRLLHIIILFFVATVALSQSLLDTLAMRAIMVNQLFPQEIVYLHFDNSAYYLGETMWFKAYVTSGLEDEEKPQSRVLYMELCAPEVDVMGNKKKDRYERPPLSEIRLDFMDEWEYAKEKIIENSLVGKREYEDTRVADILKAMEMNGQLTRNDSLIIEKTLVINNDAARKVLADDVLRSIFHRYKFGK